MKKKTKLIFYCIKYGEGWTKQIILFDNCLFYWSTLKRQNTEFIYKKEEWHKRFLIFLISKFVEKEPVTK